MNFLAHIYLSGNSEGLIIGNYIADGIKGKQFDFFHAEITKGIILHRKIDTYTDTHAIVEKSKARLRPVYRKYASVIIDILYDHYLAANWKNYSDIPLLEYSKNIYGLIKKHEHILPEKSKLFMQYMIKNDILNAYSNLNGIEKVLKGMAQRTSFESNMNLSIKEIKEYYFLFEEEFYQFFPDIQQYVNQEINIV